jgi:beta-galactosidase/beta-glucuronidase
LDNELRLDPAIHLWSVEREDQHHSNNLRMKPA